VLRIRDVVAAPGLGIGVAAGREGLANPVRWIHSSELRDPTPWLEGGELLLTTGLGIGASPAAQVAYVRRLASAGLAGLALGVGFGFEVVPRAISTVGDRLGFPVLTIPYELPFIAVTKMGFTRLAGEQLELMTDALAVHERLAALVLEGRGLEPLLDTLHECLGCGLRVVDGHGQLLGERRNGRPAVASSPALELAVGGHGEAAAVLQCWPRGDSFDEYDLLVLHHGQTAVAFELSRRRAVSATELRLAGDLFEDLEHDRLDDREIDRRLAAFGLDPAACASIVAEPAQSATPEQLRQELTHMLETEGVPHLSTARSDAAMLLVQLSEERDAVEVAHQLARLDTAARIGVGRPASGRALGRSLAEARAALEAAHPVGSYRDLGPLELILGLPDAALEAFVDRVLGDTAGNRSLIESLTTLLDCGCRWSEAAARLGVHRHTLRYRMERLRERTGRHPDVGGDRMELWLAVKAIQVLARRPDSPATRQLLFDAASTREPSRMDSPSSTSASSARTGTSTRNTLP